MKTIRQWLRCLFAVTFVLLLATCNKKNPPPPPPPPPPAITSISPASGSAGTTVTINGANFKATATDNTVKFNGLAATVQTASATVLTVLVPGSGTTGAVTVTTSDGTATGPVFTYVAVSPPTITSISPVSGSSGTTVTINGTNFKTVLTGNSVKFNGVAATVQTASATVLTVLAPASGTTGNVTVTTTDGTSNGVKFTYVTGPDIYVAGFDGPYAVYWKNGVEVLLTDGTKRARASAICVSGSDIYCAGVEGLTAKYWKNGTAVSLTNGSLTAAATGIAVSGSNVYVSGYETNRLGNTEAKCWINGVGSVLISDTTHNSLANGIVYSGNIIFVAGVDVKPVVNFQYGNPNGFYCAIPVPGIVNYFSTDTVYSYATAICSSPTGVIYVGGYDMVAGQPAPQAWHNSLPLYLSYYGYPGYCYGIAADSLGGIYTVGYTIYPGKKAVATIWKGLGATGYALTDGTNPAGAYGVAVYGSDVYVAGYEYSTTAGNYGVPKYWKNGSGVALPAGSSTAGAYAIVVK